MRLSNKYQNYIIAFYHENLQPNIYVYRVQTCYMMIIYNYFHSKINKTYNQIHVNSETLSSMYNILLIEFVVELFGHII